MPTKHLLGIILFIYLVVPVIIYVLEYYAVPDTTVEADNNNLCVRVSAQMARERAGTDHQDDNFYKSCLLNVECIRLDNCPMADIERLSNDWKASDHR